MTYLNLQPLPIDFFDDDVGTVAKSLIGVFMFSVDEFGNQVGGKIVETEAYDQYDPAAHCYSPNGKRSSKLGATEAMFLSGGHAYVYQARTSWCVNFVTGRENIGSAVLIRALIPTSDCTTLMRERHKNKKRISAWVKDDQKYIHSLCKRPGNLCVSLSINGSFNGKSLYGANSPLKLLRLDEGKPELLCGPRVNVRSTIERNWPDLDDSAKDEATQREWRFVAAGSSDYRLKTSYALRPLSR